MFSDLLVTTQSSSSSFIQFLEQYSTAFHLQCTDFNCRLFCLAHMTQPVLPLPQKSVPHSEIETCILLLLLLTHSFWHRQVTMQVHQLTKQAFAAWYEVLTRDAQTRVWEDRHCCLEEAFCEDASLSPLSCSSTCYVIVTTTRTQQLDQYS